MSILFIASDIQGEGALLQDGWILVMRFNIPDIAGGLLYIHWQEVALQQSGNDLRLQIKHIRSTDDCRIN